MFITHKKTCHMASSQFIITLLEFVFFFICLLANQNTMYLSNTCWDIINCFLQGIWHCLIFLSSFMALFQFTLIIDLFTFFGYLVNKYIKFMCFVCAKFDVFRFSSIYEVIIIKLLFTMYVMNYSLLFCLSSTFCITIVRITLI